MEDINHCKTLFVSKLDTLKMRVDNLNNYSIIEATQELLSFLFDSPCMLDILAKGKPYKMLKWKIKSLQHRIDFLYSFQFF